MLANLLLKRLRKSLVLFYHIPNGKRNHGKRRPRKGNCICVLSLKIHSAPRPKAVAIRYRKREATEVEKVASAIVSEDIVTIQEEGQDDEFDG